MKYDLIIRGGTIVDPAQEIHARKDVAFAGGLVAAIEDSIAPEAGREVVDAAGRLVCPGLVDLHVHVFPGVSHYGIDPDPTCLSRGATTVMDFGSTGADTFEGFRRFVIDVSDTRIFTLLNISSLGMISQDVGELALPQFVDVDRTVAMIEQHRDVILGVKVRLSNWLVSEACGMMPLHKAREAADATRLPLMVHPQAAWCDSLDDILAVMGRGDVLTHLYHPMECGIFDDQGNVRTSVRDAAERGVMFDVGHGQGSFDWAMADSGLAQRLLPHVISSDLHFHNVHGPVYDLVGVASKFLHLGLSLDDVIARVTRAPADVLGMGDRIGTLAPGAFGDAVVLEERAGAFSMEDAFGTVRTVERRLEPIVVVKGGRIYRDHC